MKRFSLEGIVSGIKKTVERFPMVVLTSVAGTIIGLVLIHHEDGVPVLSKLFLTLILAFLLFICATIFTEQRDSSQKKTVFSAVTIFLVAYYFLFAVDMSNFSHAKYITQYVLWVAGAGMLVLFAPFIKKPSLATLDFWYYNKRIFYAFFSTFIYSVAIYAGLSVALLSINFLFDLNIDSIRWAELWITTVGIFGTTFFLSRFPCIEDKVVEIIYPKELKIFTYYVLVPLVCIYFLILYSYTAKILITWVWPKGVVSSMILGFSILGILTYVILYPLTLIETKLQKISKIFFLALLPQVMVLFWALWLRVSDYGITEKRYLLIVFGLWLLAVSLYFLISKVKNIRLIAISLFVIFVGISFGPWGISSVSEYSQVHRLQNILEKNSMLVEGIVRKTEEEPSRVDTNEINEILRYLHENHGFHSIQPWFNGELIIDDSAVCAPYSRSIDRECVGPEKVAKLLGISYSYVSAYQQEENFSFDLDSYGYRQGLKVSGYDYVVANADIIDIDGNQYTFSKNTENFEFVVYKNEKSIATISFKNLFDSLSEEYKQTKNNHFSPEQMSLAYEDQNLKIKIYFSSINGNKSNMWTSERMVISFK